VRTQEEWFFDDIHRTLPALRRGGPNCLFLIEDWRRGRYLAFEQDAEALHREFGLAVEYDTRQRPFVQFRRELKDAYCRKLLDLGCSVHLCERVKEAEAGDEGQKGGKP
jgi:hypothetical protein